MKSKVTVIILEFPHRSVRLNAGQKTRLVVDNDGNFLSRYISTKTVPETLQELLYDYGVFDMRYFDPVLAEFIHQKGSDECEAIYVLKIPRDSVSLHDGYLAELTEINIEERYERVIGHTPRSI